jgi:hypothetical protein
MTLREKLVAFCRVNLNNLLGTTYYNDALALSKGEIINEQKLIPLAVFAQRFGLSKYAVTINDALFFDEFIEAFHPVLSHNILHFTDAKLNWAIPYATIYDMATTGSETGFKYTLNTSRGIYLFENGKITHKK